jgi:hypothetical protein
VSQASTFRALEPPGRPASRAPVADHVATGGGLEDFVDTVVLILRERGLFRTEYTGRTLREHLGLPRPENRFAKRTAAAAG